MSWVLALAGISSGDRSSPLRLSSHEAIAGAISAETSTQAATWVVATPT
ncbi:hypothetical protein [Salinicola sp. CR57]|nr:hypothetical protein [Salinicola sp. CR57]